MDDARWERWAAATGLAFFLFLALSVFVVPASPPKAADSAAKIASYYSDHRSGLLLGGLLSGLAVAFALWFVGSLRSYLRSAEGGTGRLSAVGFGAALVGGSVAIGASAITSAIAFKIADSGSKDVVRAFYDLASMAGLLLWFPLAVWVLATSMLALRTGAFPKWYGQIGVVLTLVFLVNGIGLVQDSGPFAAGGFFGYLSFILFGLWVLATALLLYMRVGKPMARASAG